SRAANIYKNLRIRITSVLSLEYLFIIPKNGEIRIKMALSTLFRIDLLSICDVIRFITGFSMKANHR
ncbi:MAG: hypothetical protein E7E17_00730, partial [Veillonella sp.]|nr:hypothetical protein [Veillonella sp.]